MAMPDKPKNTENKGKESIFKDKKKHVPLSERTTASAVTFR